MASLNILVKTVSFYLKLFHRYGILKNSFFGPPTLYVYIRRVWKRCHYIIACQMFTDFSQFFHRQTSQ